MYYILPILTSIRRPPAYLDLKENFLNIVGLYFVIPILAFLVIEPFQVALAATPSCQKVFTETNIQSYLDGFKQQEINPYIPARKRLNYAAEILEKDPEDFLEICSGASRLGVPPPK